MTRLIDLDDATVLALERHETHAHAIPSREVRVQGDALVLFDPRDPDPFWNRMVSVRWPAEPAAFDRRLAEAITLFGILDRTPHVWPSPVHSAPRDLVERLRAHGLPRRRRRARDGAAGPGDRPARSTRPSSGSGVTLTAIRRAARRGAGRRGRGRARARRVVRCDPGPGGGAGRGPAPDARRPADHARPGARGRSAGGGRQGDVDGRLHLPLVDRDAGGVPGTRASAGS